MYAILFDFPHILAVYSVFYTGFLVVLICRCIRRTLKEAWIRCLIVFVLKKHVFNAGIFYVYIAKAKSFDLTHATLHLVKLDVAELVALLLIVDFFLFRWFSSITLRSVVLLCYAKDSVLLSNSNSTDLLEFFSLKLHVRI